MQPRKVIVSVVLLACIGGCGPATAPVKGTVSFNREPIERGTISFEPADGVGPSTQDVIRNGAYSLHGELSPTVGPKIVRITGARKTGKKFDAGGQQFDELRQFLPPRYNDQSTLTADIVAGKVNEHNFELQP